MEENTKLEATPPWYIDFFGQDYLRIYSPFLSPERTRQEVEGIISLLDLPKGSRILDLCCGEGRHAIPLARHGYQVTGQDLSALFLAHAQQEAETHQLAIRWLHQDMRTIPFHKEFDAIINMFSSFGYLETDEANQLVLQQIAQALKPGGLFIMETIYQPRVIRNFTPHGIIRYPDNLIVLEERKLDLLQSRNDIHISLILPDGQRREYRQSMRIYTLTELVQMLQRASLTLQAAYGDLDGGPLTLDSRLVLVCKKDLYDQ
ncbi:methyltransferase type 11 [Tengunoibacter tsumagoiensis]|uniref:Methyltransferase type 11 n=1 Tax=Tengunoibacter tsumagoiensis TaxID=2014871 RepID=A0A402A1M8_9CHLR|nr:methyltransferase type 11 [Tengunoibacter tsumagoiensis]